ncbi:MAG: hypothetical protein LIP77_10085 [Planctomycetes bacterium]|nr:hypothetical protein [Planctomycetota bacterium]
MVQIVLTMLVASRYNSYFLYREPSTGIGIITLAVHVMSAITAYYLFRSQNDAIRRDFTTVARTAKSAALWNLAESIPWPTRIDESRATPAEDWKAHTFTLRNGLDVSAQVSTYGARIVSLKGPVNNGEIQELLPSGTDPETFLTPTSLCNAVINPTTLAGEFSIADRTLAQRFWEGRVDGDAVVMRHADGDTGLTLTVTFRLTGRDLAVTYQAETARPLLVNPAHALWFDTAALESYCGVAEVAYIPATGVAFANGILGPEPYITTENANSGLQIWRLTSEDRSCFFQTKADSQTPVATLVNDSAGRSLAMLTDCGGVWMCAGKCVEPFYPGPAVNTRTILVLMPIVQPESLRPVLPGEHYQKTVVYRLGVTWEQKVAPQGNPSQPDLLYDTTRSDIPAWGQDR